MFYQLIDIKRDGKKRKWYVYRDNFDNKIELTAKQIKENWDDNIFQGVKLDKAGRVIEAKKPDLVESPLNSGTHLGQFLWGDNLVKHVNAVIKGMSKRDAVDQIVERLEGEIWDRLILVEGLKGTGKTTAILQAIQVLFDKGVSVSSIVYIDADLKSFSDKYKYIVVQAEPIARFVRDLDFEYVFIDGITNAEGTLDWLRFMSDTVFLSRKKIVLSGDESYLWLMARRIGNLYDRTISIDLTYLTFKEYSEIFPERVKGLTQQEIVKEFCISGGVLSEIEDPGMVFRSIATSIVGAIKRNTDHPRITNHTGPLFSATEVQLVELILVAGLEVYKTQNEDKFKNQNMIIPELGTDIKKIEFLYNFLPHWIHDVFPFLFMTLRELKILDTIDNLARKSKGIVPVSNVEFVCHISRLYYSAISKFFGKKDIAEDEFYGDSSIGMDKEALAGVAFKNLILSQCVQFINLLNRQYFLNRDFKEVIIGYCRYSLSQKKMLEYGEKNKTPEVDLVIKLVDSRKVLSSCLIKVKPGIHRTPRYTKNMFLRSMRDAVGFVDKYIVVYNGETQKIKDVDYVNAVEFLMDIGKWVFNQDIIKKRGKKVKHETMQDFFKGFDEEQSI